MPYTEAQQARLKAVGAAVRRARDTAGFSQERLADEAGLHRTYVGSLERGERNIGVLNLYALADVLGVPTGDLLPENANLSAAPLT